MQSRLLDPVDPPLDPLDGFEELLKKLNLLMSNLNLQFWSATWNGHALSVIISFSNTRVFEVIYIFLGKPMYVLLKPLKRNFFLNEAISYPVQLAS